MAKATDLRVNEWNPVVRLELDKNEALAIKHYIRTGGAFRSDADKASPTSLAQAGRRVVNTIEELPFLGY